MGDGDGDGDGTGLGDGEGRFSITKMGLRGSSAKKRNSSRLQESSPKTANAVNAIESLELRIACKYHKILHCVQNSLISV